MSVVTNVILSIGLADDEENDGVAISRVNQFFEPPRIGFVSCDSPLLPRGWYGGTKMLEANLYIGAFNHFVLAEFLEFLGRLEWNEPRNVQLFVKEEDDDRFRLINLAD